MPRLLEGSPDLTPTESARRHMRATSQSVEIAGSKGGPRRATYWGVRKRSRACERATAPRSQCGGGEFDPPRLHQSPKADGASTGPYQIAAKSYQIIKVGPIRIPARQVASDRCLGVVRSTVARMTASPQVCIGSARRLPHDTQNKFRRRRRPFRPKMRATASTLRAFGSRGDWEDQRDRLHCIVIDGVFVAAGRPWEFPCNPRTTRCEKHARAMGSWRTNRPSWPGIVNRCSS